MTATNLDLWIAPGLPAVPDTLSDPNQIASRALQLRERERQQIATNFQAGNYELASAFVWMRTMALLKIQLASLGMEFIGELLQRPDINEFSDVRTAVSDAEAISLARDLGIVTPLQTMRLLQSQAVVSHFAGVENDPSANHDEVMTQEEAILCLRVCVQGVLGHEQVAVAEDFKLFRTKLESETMTTASPEIVKLTSSPYFFIRTAISILLSLFKTSKGAQLEHTARNASLIIPLFWGQLKAPERWQIGQAYAHEFSEGRRDSVKGLHAVLLAVAGFDYVPENLRSTTFVQVASSVIAAHQGMNNFYNEPGPMRELASLGTSIPGPALAICISAVLCVKLGNFYGTSWAAQAPANQIIAGLSKERWLYYFNERFENDRLVLSKLIEDGPATNWVQLIQALQLEPEKIVNKETRALIVATNAGEKSRVQSISMRIFKASVH
ncbi:hypothetical protein NKI54_09915 [Mesorhizobium sp. M0663]|uniref:hypothetical protein n=1 Tax=Mesorhizobium sp. M0663 TaxID=2956981 RepID=UPI00333A0CB7